MCIAFYTIFILCTLTLGLPLTCCLCFFHRTQAGKTDELAASHKGVTFQADRHGCTACAYVSTYVCVHPLLFVCNVEKYEEQKNQIEQLQQTRDQVRVPASCTH